MSATHHAQEGPDSRPFTESEDGSRSTCPDDCHHDHAETDAAAERLQDELDGVVCGPSHLDFDGYCDHDGCPNWGHTYVPERGSATP
jgi:hypothetical protein